MSTPFRVCKIFALYSTSRFWLCVCCLQHACLTTISSPLASSQSPTTHPIPLPACILIQTNTPLEPPNTNRCACCWVRSLSVLSSVRQAWWSHSHPTLSSHAQCAAATSPHSGRRAYSSKQGLPLWSHGGGAELEPFGWPVTQNKHQQVALVSGGHRLKVSITY